MAHAFAAPLGGEPVSLLDALLGERAEAYEEPARRAGAQSKLRLTRRGRFVLIAMPMFIVSVLLLVGLAAFMSPAHAGDTAPARIDAVQVTVQQGQSLWSVAAQYAPDRDPRVVISEIVDLNGLDSTRVQPGQQLMVPKS
ncbi:LysM peptidoglycan-binding domain-containing protein [Sinomonas sp. ASV322]|uniref:LysM peptidoglycan-binding domain-containing protein n=1 Tax=Sinomonas sp. ASV322 TaxID=3041920 RepID=UPI0027DC21F7|nr:LysM peptidoglycan-binding domain-containing protein [Sinomonas sp. ASV322]MDQ4502666.1 LysM peptidoglycan-binding domain-containing protein [Sinomonas sp. ASV322]